MQPVSSGNNIPGAPSDAVAGEGSAPNDPSAPPASVAAGGTVAPPPSGGPTTGNTGGPSTAPSGDPTAPGASTPPVNTTPTVAPSTVTQTDGTAVDCTTLVRPPTPLRRLTQFEYNNTVRDLLGTTLTPADAFPPDEVADGFTNNARVLTVSGLHAEKYVEASEALAAEVVPSLAARQLLPCDPASGAEACAQQFAESFGRQAFRRNLEAEDVAVLMEAYAAGSAQGFERGIEVMIRAILQSPHFLYRVEFTGAEALGAGMIRLTGFETASRLSYLLWGSAPDKAMLDAAAGGLLDTPEQVAAQARLMIQDPKAKQAASEFFRQWLSLNRLGVISKDTELFPNWNEDLRTAMIAETGAFVEHVLWAGEGTLNALFTEPAGLPQGPLAALYGVPATTDGKAVALPAEQRVGVLTLPGFMSVQAHPDQTSPVLRGKFIRARLLCQPPSPPPPDADVTPPPPGEGGTARERFSRHASDAECNACHQLMDPLGFAFENYDAMGAYRTTDVGQEIDVSGEVLGSADMDGTFVGVAGLAEKLAGSQQVQNCVATQWFKYAVGRTEERGDACSMRPLQVAFGSNNANLLELMVSMTQTEAFLYRRAETESAQ